MRKLLPIFLLALTATFTGCNRDPQVVKKKYFDTGKTYRKQNKLKEASIMYRNALKKDQRYGEAYWRLGDVELQRGEVVESVKAYRRATELLPNNPEPASSLANIYLLAYSARQNRDPKLLDEADLIADTLLKNNQKSFDGLRIKAVVAGAKGQYKDSIKFFESALAVSPNKPEIRIGLAQALTADNQFDRGEQIAKSIISSQKEYAPAYEFLANQYLRRNRAADAETIMQQRASAFPKNSLFKMQHAAYFFVTKRQPQGEAILNEILSNPKDFPEGQAQVGDFYMRFRQYDKALGYYQKGLDAETDKAKKNAFRLRMALTQGTLRKYPEALAFTDQILKEDPKNDDALQLRASLILQSGDKAKTSGAINDLQALITRTPSNAAIRYNLARAYQQRGEIDAARVQYQEAIKIRPDFVTARIGLAQILMAKREFGQAIQMADEVLRLDQNNLAARLIRTRGLMASNNLQQARADLDIALAKNAENPDLLYTRALIDFRERKFKDASDTIAKLRQSFPADPRLLLAMADLNVATGKPDTALQMLQDELKKSPERQDLRAALAATAVATNNLPLAAQEYRALAEKNPNSLDLHIRLADVLRRQGDTNGSLEVIRKAQASSPNDPTANLQLALTLEYAGQFDQARPYYETVLKAQPDNPVALNNLAYRMAESGQDIDQALTYAQRAKQRWPSSDDVSDTLGWIYIKKNLSDNAVQIFQDLVTKQPKNSTFHYHLGMALYQKGDKVKARESLQTALANKPGKDEESKIRELLSKLG